jgi:hypothetical protein
MCVPQPRQDRAAVERAGQGIAGGLLEIGFRQPRGQAFAPGELLARQFQPHEIGVEAERHDQHGEITISSITTTGQAARHRGRDRPDRPAKWR